MEKINNPKNSLRNLSKIKWACRRGMLELDMLLEPFVEGAYLQLTEEEQADFLRLLEYPDPDLFLWLMGKDAPTDPALNAIVCKVRDYAKSRF